MLHQFIKLFSITMTTNSISDRRILTFPTFHLHDFQSPSKLLSSLLSLTSKICIFPSASSPPFRSIIRELHREVSSIQMFIEYVINHDVRLPAFIFNCLYDLHSALQKLNYLLCDCSRRGARIWLLMNHDHVILEFKGIIRVISTTLASMELDFTDVDEDIKAVVTMLVKQTSTIEIGIDGNTNSTVRTVRSIFKQFRNRSFPNLNDLRKVLDHLNVKNWSDCNEEVDFLENEILEYSGEVEDDNEEFALLGSLLAFMIYSRAVLFDVDCATLKAYRNKKLESGRIDMGCFRKESFMCPISLETMTDPVTISTGQTYDRNSIVRWFKDGNFTCPVTGKAVSSKIFVPNFLLQKIIQDNILYSSSSSNKRRDLSKTLLPRSNAAKEATRKTAGYLVKKLQRSQEEITRAAYEIRLLSKSNLFQRICLVEADSVPWLLRLITSPDSSVQDNAAASLLNISKTKIGREAIIEIGLAHFIVHAITEGLTVEVQQNAAAILFYLSSEYGKEVGEIPEAIPALVHLVDNGTFRAKKNALVALSNLLSYPLNHKKVLSTDAIFVLNGLLTDEREDLASDCVRVLAKIADSKEGTDAMLNSLSSIIPDLVQVLHSSTTRSRMENSVSLTLSLCCNGGLDVAKQFGSMPLFMPSLYSIYVALGGHPQGKKKATSLLEHIHRIYD